MAEAVVQPVGGMRVRFGFLLSLSLLGLLLLMWVALAVSTDSFFTANNFENLLRQASLWAIILKAGVPIWLSIGLTLMSGVAIGAFHAFGILKLGLPPFIMTLATLTAL